MREAWREFKGFAMGGNMLDLALLLHQSQRKP